MHSGDHLLTLINEVLDLSKIEAGQIELNNSAFWLDDFIDSIGKMFVNRCRQKAIELRITGLSTCHAYVETDKGKLQQILINLLSNAIKFTDQGFTALHIQPQADAAGFSISVSDSGCGIAPDALASVFDAFHQEARTAKRGGTGLGLAIVKKYIHLMGGDIQAESTPDQGARFICRLPIQISANAPQQDSASIDAEFTARLRNGQHIRALIVDDNQDNRNVLCDILKSIKVQVQTANNGKLAISLLQHHPYDIVIMDIRMPVMDGIETIQFIRANTIAAQTKFVALTASITPEKRDLCLQHGFDYFTVPKF